MRVQPPSKDQTQRQKGLRASLLALAATITSFSTGCYRLPMRTAGAVARPEPKEIAVPSEKAQAPANALPEKPPANTPDLQK